MEIKDDRKFLRWLFVWLLPIILLYVTIDRGGGSVAVKEMIAIVLLGLGLMFFWGLKSIKMPPKWLSYLWLAFWIWGMLTFVTTWSPDGTLIWTMQFCAFFCLALFVFALSDEPLWVFFRVLSIGFAIVLIIGYFFIIGARTGIFIGRHDMMLHFISTFYWKNPAAGYLMLMLPVSFALSFVEPKKGWRIFYVCLSLLALAALSLTRSRGGWLAFLIALVIGFFFAIPVLKKLMPRAILVLILSIVISFCIVPPSWLVKRASQVSEVVKSQPEEQVEERKLMLDMGWRIVKDNPLLGVGMGAFKIAYPVYLKDSHYLSFHLHNQYIQYAAEGGIMATILFSAAIFVTIFCILWFALKRKDLLLLGLGIGTLAFAIHIGLDFDWDFWGATLMFIVLLSIGARRVWDEKAFAIEGARRFKFTLAILIFFLISLFLGIAGTLYDRFDCELDRVKRKKLLSLCVTLDPLSSKYWYEYAQLYAASDNREEALKALDKAYRLEPKNSLLPYAYGVLLWDTNQKRAIEYMEKAISTTPYVLPETQLSFAQKAKEAGLNELAKNIFEKMLHSFSTNPDTRYNERTAAHRYIVSRAIVDLSDIALLSDDLQKADSLCRFAGELGCPRYWDLLARTWGLDIISPEQTVAEMLDAVNMHDTLRARIYIADSAMVRVSEGNEIFLVQIMSVTQDMISEKASVDALTARMKNNKVLWEFGFFNLVIDEGRWKVKY